jgi:hypothetical protein
MRNLYQEQCRRDDEHAKKARNELTIAEWTKEQRAFWDAAAIGALSASSGSGDPQKTAKFAAEIADCLLIERETRKDNGEI